MIIDNNLFRHLRSAGENKMHLKPKRRHATKSNPVKALQDRQDVRTETEVNTLLCEIVINCSCTGYDICIYPNPFRAATVAIHDIIFVGPALLESLTSST